MEQATWLLQQLAIPSAATVSVDCTLRGSERPTKVRRFDSALRTSWLEKPLEQCSSSAVFQHLLISIQSTRDGRDLGILGWLDCSLERLGSSLLTDHSALTLSVDEEEDSATFPLILTTIGAADVQHLEMASDYFWYSPDDIVALSLLPKLNVISTLR